MKNNFYLLLSGFLTLSLLLSGCGKAESGKDEAKDHTQKSITMLNIKGEIQSQVESLGAAYEAETGVHVNVLGVNAGVDAQATLKGYYLSD